MNLNQEIIKDFLSREMAPGRWYEVKDLIALMEDRYKGFTPWDREAVPSEPQRPRWHRLVTNSVRLSPGRDDYDDDSWVELRTRRPKRNFQYSIAPRDPVEEELIRRVRFDDGSGHVYAITNPAWPGWVKIGMTIDIDGRLAAYQIYSPGKDYSVAHSVEVRDRRRSEAFAHRRASDASAGVSGEWFKIPMAEAANILELCGFFDSSATD